MSAAGAFLRVIQYFRQEYLTLRIVAPSASQGTTLEENGGPDTGAVMNAKLLNVKDNRLIHSWPFFLCYFAKGLGELTTSMRTILLV